MRLKSKINLSINLWFLSSWLHQQICYIDFLRRQLHNRTVTYFFSIKSLIKTILIACANVFIEFNKLTCAFRVFRSELWFVLELISFQIVLKKDFVDHFIELSWCGTCVLWPMSTSTCCNAIYRTENLIFIGTKI